MTVLVHLGVSSAPTHVRVFIACIALATAALCVFSWIVRSRTTDRRGRLSMLIVGLATGVGAAILAVALWCL